MELFSLLVVIIVIYAMYHFRKSAARIGTYVEDQVTMNTREASTDFEERTLVVQQRIEALDEAHPNRVRFADIDSLFVSQKNTPASKSKK